MIMSGYFSPKKLVARISLIGKHKRLTHPDTLEAPLLSRQDIFDLYYRVQDRFRLRQNPYEVAHRMLGDNRSVYKGYGLDYEESRSYQPGDELRFMNWRVTARTGQLMMKVYREERRPGIFVLLDRRPTMRFGTQVRIKAAQAARVAALVSFIAQKENTQVGGVILNQDANWIPEQSGSEAAFRLVNQASKPCPPLNNNNETTSLHYILKVMTRVLTRGSTVYLLSDFHDLDENSRAALIQLAAEHQIVAYHIMDPAELDLPKAGDLNLTEPNNSPSQSTQTVKVQSENKKLRQHYKQQAQHHITAIQKILTSAGINYHRIMSHIDNIEREI